MPIYIHVHILRVYAHIGLHTWFTHVHTTVHTHMHADCTCIIMNTNIYILLMFTHISISHAPYVPPQLTNYICQLYIRRVASRFLVSVTGHWLRPPLTSQLALHGYLGFGGLGDYRITTEQSNPPAPPRRLITAPSQGQTHRHSLWVQLRGLLKQD